ncbi:hypothetical protein D3C84_1047880 [compost metagenome]
MPTGLSGNRRVNICPLLISEPMEASLKGLRTSTMPVFSVRLMVPLRRISKVA